VVELQKLSDSDILFRSWESPAPKAAFLLVHGIGAHSARWDFLAEYFLKQGFSSYAIELKGFGETQDRPQGHIDNYGIYYEDLRQLALHIKQKNPGRKIFIVGESLGAFFALYSALVYPELYDGLICVSPAFKNAIAFSLLDYLFFLPNFIFNPTKLIRLNFNLGMCTRDRDYVKKMENDPREIRQASVKLLANFLLTVPRVKRMLKKINLPMLFLLAGIDYLVDPRASKKMFGQIRLKDKRLIEYPEMYHALSIELGREKVFADILNWIEPRL